MDKKLNSFLDDAGRLKQLPAKQSVRNLASAYLAEKFAYDVEYSEAEVNALLSEWSTFGDWVTLRRELIESRWLLRVPSGKAYWKNDEKRQSAAAIGEQER